MTTTLMPTAARRYQHSVPKLEIAAAEERELRAMLLATIAALDCRPKANIDFWNHLAAKDADIRHPAWLNRLTEILRTALEAAREEGPGTQAATVHRVHVFFDSLAALTLRGYETSPATALNGALVELTKESSDVTVAAARALNEPSEQHLEQLRHEVAEEITEGERVLELTARTLAAHRSPAPCRLAR